ncbi:MAG: chlorohydrolase [Isosphaeraceae bacterium]|nr:MAG: chlorohydrolase [Isosphaeraceae bacterium]
MNASAGPLTLAARHLVPIEGPPVSPGRLTIEAGRIVALEPGTPRPGDLDLGSVAILPGLVNCHVHLDLPPLGGPPAGVVDLASWLEHIVNRRAAWAPRQAIAQVEAGIAASMRSGTTLLADITPAGLSWDALAASPIRAVVFAELIGLRRERAMATSAQAFEWLGQIRRSGFDRGRLRPGLSPHAPYSTVGWLYERAAAAGVPLSTHLAESPAETEFLNAGTGPLRAFLERIGAWPDDAWAPLGPRPADYIRKGALKQADWIVAHGTYLDESDFWQLRPQAAPSGQRVAVAYCPRSTAYFGHGPHPFAAMIERGIAVALGTDSLASTPSLSILDEIRWLHQRHPELPAQLLLLMGTLAGAWALRFDDEVGSLVPGKRADLAVVSVDPTSDEPAQAVVAGRGPVIGTMVDGTWVYGPCST